MQHRRANLLSACLLALAAPAAALAQNAAVPVAAAGAPAQGAAAAAGTQDTRDRLTSLPSAQDLRPTGPITISANHAEALQGNTATYTGNVVLNSNTLKMDGDRLDLRRGADGQYEVKLTGAPAHVSHASSGADDPSLDAHARTVNYDSRSGIIDLLGEAYFKRGNDVTTSDTIRYYVAEQRYEGTGRVTIVIPPAPGATPGAASAPQPAPAPTAAPAPAGSPAPGGTHP
ncbi:MAG: hypothetical protein ISP90_07790 [Nevskia sp.]|nr:hypothetical protein [Nevskia sp.]